MIAINRASAIIRKLILKRYESNNTRVKIECILVENKIIGLSQSIYNEIILVSCNLRLKMFCNENDNNLIFESRNRSEMKHSWFI